MDRDNTCGREREREGVREIVSVCEYVCVTERDSGSVCGCERVPVCERDTIGKYQVMCMESYEERKM